MWRYFAFFGKVAQAKSHRFFLIGLVVNLLFLGFLGRAGAQQVSPARFAFTGSSSVTGGANFRPILPGKGLEVGPVQLHPSLGAAGLYVDNAFKTDTNRRSDFIYIIAPKIQAQLPLGGRHRFVIDYRAAQIKYKRFSSNDVLAQDAWGRLVFNFPVGLAFDFQGGHTEGFDPRGSELDIQDTDITKWNTNTFIGRAEWFGARTGIELTARYTRWNYENNNQDLTRDQLSNSADLTLLGSLTPKTFATLNFGVDEDIYDQNKQLDSFTYRVSAGLRWAATEKLSGFLQAGYEVLNFDRAPVEQPDGSELSSGGNGEEILNISGDVRWRPTSKWDINLRPFRNIEQSAVFNTSVFTRTGVLLRVRHRIGSRTTLTGAFSVSRDKFKDDEDTDQTGNRKDTRILGIMGLEYRAIKWLGLRLDYRYEQRNSNEKRFEFFANTVMVSIQGML